MTSPHKISKPIIMQNIKSNESEAEYSADVVGQQVYVNCIEGAHTLGSSKVKLTNRSDYNWEFKYYHGNLVAAHIGGRIMAYAMKGKDGGMVRVSNIECDKRAIIKNLKDDIKDLSFAYCRQDIILGIVDSEGNILIYEINDEPQSISYNLLLHIFHHETVSRSKVNYRLIWCPYLSSYEDEDSADDPEKMFVVLNGNRAEICNVTIMNQKYGSETIDPNDGYDGYIEINHKSDLVDASFSSDGTAIAIASLDGSVKFFQLYMVDVEKQKCLHEWRPHDGKPLSSIIFIDNVLEYSSECWKFTITGANHNAELKLWSCESWTCLQTIYFDMETTSLLQNIYLKMSIDYTGQYLVMSDVNNKVLYVLELKRNDKEKSVCVTTLSQFLLPNPFLSYHILEANTRKVPFSYNNSTEDLYDDERDDFDEDAYTMAICLKMLVIQPKKFQECNIKFEPEALLANTTSTLNDMNGKEMEQVPTMDVALQSSVNLLMQSGKSQLNLMTPEDFKLPDQISRPSSERTISIPKEVVLNKPLEKVADSVEKLIDFERPHKDNFASGGSSPSREVQEILSLNNSTYSAQDYYEDLPNLKEKPDKPQNDLDETNDADVVVWPKIPVVNNNEIISKDCVTNDVAKSSVQAMNFRLSSLESVIREQNIVLQSLQQELKDLKSVGRAQSDNKEEFVKELDLAMSKQHLHIAKMLENLVNVQKNHERGMHEQIIEGLGQILTKTLSEHLQVIVAHEMKHVVLPAIRTLIDSYTHQFDAQYAQKLINTDVMLKDNIAKALNNKALAETLSISVVKSVAPSLEKSYKDIIASSLVPSWERICGTMFQQINDAFTRGTKEYTLSVENYMDKQRRVQEKGRDMVVQMQTVSDNIKTNTDKLTSTLTSEIHKQFSSAFKNMQDKLTHSIKDVVSEQVKQGFKSHASVIEDSVINAVRSRAVTPSPHVDTQVTLNHIQHSLSRGNFDEAFQFALSAENLSFVIYVCERVDINKLFAEECLLQQSCLLALIQQLSMELSKNSDLKLSFIRAAFLALSFDCQNTKQFIPKVLKELLKQLNIFMQSSPTMKHMTDAKLLKMAVENMLGKSC